MRRILVVLAISLLALARAPMARGGSMELRWGGDAEGGAPYVFVNPRNPQETIGFEVDLANALGRRLHRRAVFVQNQWDGLISGLERDNYDIALNGLEITDDRKRQINFTIPYYATAEQLSVRADNRSISSLADLKGKTAGTLKYSLAERVLEREGGISLRTYDGQINAYEDLANGRLDAVLMDWPIAVYYSKPNPKLKFVGSPISEIRYGIGVRKQDGELLRQLNSALIGLIQSGELRSIYQKWGLWNSTTEALFAQIGSAPQAYEDYTKSVTRQLSWRDQLRQYAGYLPLLLGRGAPMTLAISLLGMAVAVSVGLLLALTNLYGPFFPARAARAFIEVMRGTPLLIQLYLIFYGLPSVGIRLSPFVAAIVGLGLNYAAYEAENYRGAIQAIPRGQMEAALSLGMTRAQALQHVILPQAMRLAIPPVTNDFISLFKDSSIVSVITMVELTKVYGELASTYYDYIGVGLLTAAIYFLLGLPFVRLARWAEEKLTFDQITAVPARGRWFGVGAKPATR
ncbi:MAG: transporter substrate-binding domain-containing protein [Acidobacteria bacterium]|nr:MAG: transporter substrate-binding domain-containing protein [Acidobacteriota bacterium]